MGAGKGAGIREDGLPLGWRIITLSEKDLGYIFLKLGSVREES